MLKIPNKMRRMRRHIVFLACSPVM
uniref:Uncharacterized protein n=1 Tax=Arundo donax TaxID=35708 RepID=A0A0A9RR46_ARUDO